MRRAICATWRRCGRWWRRLRAEEAKIRLGGGARAIEAQHKKQRLTARERIGLLLDEGTALFELGLHAAHGMYEEWGGAPAAGVVTGLGRVHGRLFMLIANDATVKAGAFFPMTAKKVIRAQNIAMENSLPTIYLVDSAGVFLPLQEDVFPDQDDFGRVFRNNAVMSARGIPQITAIMGMCVAGGAYLPVMCDHILMTEGSGLFLAGPALVQAAIGQKVTRRGAGRGTDARRDQRHGGLPRSRRRGVHRSGCARWWTRWEQRPEAPFDRAEAVAPLYAAEELYGIYESDTSRQYDMREILARVVDGSRFDEYKAGYGETLLCGYARIDGHAVGIVANQKMHATQIDHEGNKRTEFGGVIYTESAEKAARFIMDCNQGRIPLVFLHDVNGFMVGRDAEWSGIIRAGAKMVNAVSNSVVPKITVIVGGSFGAGHYAMCGKAYDPRFVFAWPTARYSVMSGESAAGTLVEIKLKQLERAGKAVDEAARKELYDSIRATLHGADDAAIWRGAAVDRQDHRSGRDAGGAGVGAGGGAVESGGGEIQRGSVADVTAAKDAGAERRSMETVQKVFELPITVTEADIDQLGHVNNVVYVRWVQEAATAHWNVLASASRKRRG